LSADESDLPDELWSLILLDCIDTTTIQVLSCCSGVQTRLAPAL